MSETENSQEEQSQHALTCPLLALKPQTLDDSVRRLVKTGRPDDCIREKCAWWDSESGHCAVFNIGMAAKALRIEAK